MPWGLELTFTPLDEAAPAWETEPSGPAFDAATRALRTGFGVDPVLMGVGGSIPFVGPFAAAFGGIPSLLLGPCDPGQPHPRRGREPAPRRLAQADPQRGVPARGARLAGRVPSQRRERGRDASRRRHAATSITRLAAHVDTVRAGLDERDRPAGD